MSRVSVQHPASNRARARVRAVGARRHGACCSSPHAAQRANRSAGTPSTAAPVMVAARVRGEHAIGVSAGAEVSRQANQRARPDGRIG